MKITFLCSGINFSVTPKRPDLLWAPPFPHSMAAGVFPAVQRQGHEADHSLSYSVRLRVNGAIPPLAPYKHPLPYAVVRFREVWYKSDFAQVRI